MNKISYYYYFLSADEMRIMHDKYIQNKIKKESKILNDLEGEIVPNKEESINNYLNQIKTFIEKPRKDLLASKNNDLHLYFKSLKFQYAKKGLLICERYNITNNNLSYFENISNENNSDFNSEILKNKQMMNKYILNKSENKLFGYFNFDNITSSKMLKTLTSIFALSLGAIIIILYKKNKN